MKLNVKGAENTPGLKVPFAFDLDLSELSLFGEKPYPCPITVTGMLTNRAGLVELSFEASMTAQTKCARCLKELSVSKLVKESRPLTFSDHDEDNISIIYVEGDELDMDEIVTEAVILQSDMLNLCSEDCRGLCPFCGTDLNASECGCEVD